LTIQEFDAAVGDGQHDAVFGGVCEGYGVVGRAGFVEDVVAGAVCAARVRVAALKDEDLFDAAVTVRGIRAARLHSYEDGYVAGRLVAPEEVQVNASVSRRAPGDTSQVEHEKLLAISYWLLAKQVSTRLEALRPRTKGKLTANS
jgi:hypothetical protein